MPAANRLSYGTAYLTYRPTVYFKTFYLLLAFNFMAWSYSCCLSNNTDKVFSLDYTDSSHVFINNATGGDISLIRTAQVGRGLRTLLLEIIIIMIIIVDHKVCSDHIGTFRSHLPIFSLGVRRLYVIWVYIKLLYGLFYKGPSIECGHVIPFYCL
jgi:hypothetical protein